MSEQPPVAPPPPDDQSHHPAHVPPQGPPQVPAVPPSDAKPPFSWGKFFLGAASLPALALVVGALSAGASALSDATGSRLPLQIAGPLASVVMLALLVGAIVALFLPKWRAMAAGVLACAALLAILAGAACIALIAALSQAS